MAVVGWFRISTVAMLVGLAAGVDAQRVWTVDQQNRPGTDFTDIPPAVQAAAVGDTIFVRGNGTYTAPTLTRGVRLVGEPPSGPYPIQLTGRLQILQLPAGHQCTVANFGLSFNLFYPPYISEVFRCADNRGGVHLENVSMWDVFTSSGGDFATVTRNALVTAKNCTIRAGLRSFWVTDSWFWALGTSFSSTGMTGNDPPATPLRCDRSQMVLTDCEATGTIWAPYLQCPSPIGAIFSNDSLLVLAGQTRAFGAQAQGPIYCPFTQAPAVSVGGNSIVITDRTVTLQVQNPDLPRSELTSISWSRTAQHSASATVTGPPGTLALLAASLPAIDPVWWNGMPFWLDPNSIVVLGIATIGSSRSFSVPFPIWPGYGSGSPTALQALTLRGPVLGFSVPAMALDGPP